jgi:hypothetical protein
MAHVGQEQALGACGGFGLGARALDLGRLAQVLGHVGQGAYPALGAPFRARLGHGLRVDPALAAVGMQHAEALLQRLRLGEAAPPGPAHPRAVGRMQRRHPALARGLARGQAGDLAPALVDVVVCTQRVGLEDAHGHRGGKLPEARLAGRQRARGGAGVAHVAQDHGEVGAAVEFQVCDRGLGVEQAAVRALALDLGALAHAPRGARRVGETPHVLVVQRPARRRHQAGKGTPDHGRRGAAEDARRAFVEQHHLERLVGHDHRVVGDLEQARQQRARVRRRQPVQRRPAQAEWVGGHVGHALRTAGCGPRRRSCPPTACRRRRWPSRTRRC